MAHDLPLTTDLGDGIVQIRLPMAGNPMRYINGYLLEDAGAGGWTLVDCGWKADDVRAALDAGLAEVGRTLGDVRRLLITHVHFDHYGLAATLLREGVPRLGMHPRDWAVAQEILADPRAADLQADAWTARNGFELDGSIEDDEQHHRTELAEPTDLLEDGARVGRLSAIWTPGHTPGHLCFFDSVSGKVLTGDHVLDPVTPHVGVWREGRGDPLGNYVNSLRAVAALPSHGALPAHGEPFADLPGRVDELLAHHEHREAQVLAVLAKGATSGAGVARGLLWRRRGDPFDALHPAHQQFAVAETLAHLEHLRARGLVTRDDTVTPLRYSLAAVAQRV
ncbi:MAG: MBL fold metallo-hydrolase [Vulcanimicrobiaceae bacterium]|jgi:glyoxylase-like metal-dependent hydrolase (beta-lactamase superfamily II)